jgi:hypothetical protein
VPRDGSGTYTIPAGTLNPAVTGTAISSADFNDFIDDLEQAVTNSLDRTGASGGFVNPTQFTGGSEVAPGITFTGDTDTGVYRPAANEVALAAGGSQVANFTAAGVAISDDLSVGGAFSVGGVATFTGTPVLSAGITGIVKADLPALDEVASSAFTADTNSTIGADLGSEITLPAATGRPIMVVLQSGNTGFGMNVYVESDAGGGRYATIKIQRKIGAGAYATIAMFYGSSAASTTSPVVVTPFIDTPGAGAISYKVVGLVSNALGRVYTTACQLVAFEL